MVRWRLCLLLAMLLILPGRGSKSDEGEDETHLEEAEEEDDDDDDDDDDDEAPPTQRLGHVPMIGRRMTGSTTARTSSTTELVTRTAPRRPLECYVCAYKAEMQLRSCLDPTKYRVHTMICHSSDDRCFTSVISKGNSYETVMRGCRSGCVQSPETTCCDLNQCNNQALALPIVTELVSVGRQSLKKGKFKSKCNKAIPPSMLFFVTILLILQTVVKVAFV